MSIVSRQRQLVRDQALGRVKFKALTNKGNPVTALVSFNVTQFQADAYKASQPVRKSSGFFSGITLRARVVRDKQRAEQAKRNQENV